MVTSSSRVRLFISSILSFSLILLLSISAHAAPPLAPPWGPVTPPTLTLSGPAIDTVLVNSGVIFSNILVEKDIPHTFNTGGTAQGWNADDADWDYSLPFSFTYYGVTYATGHTIKISSNGRICFDNTQSCTDTSGNIAYGPYGPQIAPLWRDLYTGNGGGDDIYITQNSGSVTFRWQAKDCCGPNFSVNFSATLFSNGQIQFDYGDHPVPYDSIYQSIGVSSGDGTHYTLSPKSSLSSYDNISSSLWSYAFGYNDPGVTWTDSVDGSGRILLASSGSVDITTPGTYILEYTYTNSRGTGATVTRTVNVVNADSIAPVVTLVGSGTVRIPQGTIWSDSGATWIDNMDGTGSISVASSGSVNSSVIGTYILTYRKIDAAGNTGSVNRTVIVTDITPPVLTLIDSGSISISQGSSWTDLGARWTDNIDGTGTITTATSGSVNAAVAWTYTLTYIKVDAAGNTGSITRTITVSPISGGGGGGGGGGSSSSFSTPSISTTTNTSTPVVTPNTTTTVTKNTTQEVIQKVVVDSKKATVVSTPTTLKRWTVIIVYRTLNNGKQVKAGTTRVSNGVIKYTTHLKGTYSFIKK